MLTKHSTIDELLKQIIKLRKIVERKKDNYQKELDYLKGEEEVFKELQSLRKEMMKRGLLNK